MTLAVPVVDIDSHVTEPPDLWTSRLAKETWGDRVPHLEPDERTGEMCWRIGDQTATGVATYAMAGWTEFFPSHPPSLEQADPAAWDPTRRLERMDEYGIDAQVLYPNLLAFSSSAFIALDDGALMLSCVQAYNDFLTDFAAEDPRRLVPMTAIPFWDVEASVREIRRCHALGHKGIIFASKFENIGLPPLRDEHWTPIFEVAQELGLPINFHIGFATAAPGAMKSVPTNLDFTRIAPVSMLGNADLICELIVSGLCLRYPDVAFVSVESGAGWLPFLIESLDWQWLNNGLAKDHPDIELPSFYFRRQIYGSFWFERDGLDRVLELYPDNLMFETDFPHPTSLSPGPASYAKPADELLAENLAGVPADIVQKVLHDNAARVYALA